MFDEPSILDPDGLLEYSVVFSDHSLNHMSERFQGVMKEIDAVLKGVYRAAATVLVPGGGTFGMEAIARQFVQQDDTVLVVRNGFFSYRWSQIFAAGKIGRAEIVCCARAQDSEIAGQPAPYAPAPVDEVLETIRREKPAVIFVPHVETASGILMPDEYLRAIGMAAREVGALFVLDCIASGALWVDMQALAVDVLLSAPQKGWSASPCAALVMLGARALERLEQTQSSSFACDLKKWRHIMQAYETGGHAYHATLPTDALVRLCEMMQAARTFGFDGLRSAQIELGALVRSALLERGFSSVAAAAYAAPSVVVSYTNDAALKSGARMREHGVQIAAGVPLHCGEDASAFSTFRIGLFGLAKLRNPQNSCARLMNAFDKIAL